MSQILKKKLIIFSSNSLESIIEKGNYNYLRHYESYFSRVYVFYLTGYCNKKIKVGKTILFSLGSKQGFLLNIFKSIGRCLKVYKKINPYRVLTADIVWSFWTMAFVRLFTKIYLMPVCHVNEIVANKKPYFFKKKIYDTITMQASFLFADFIVLGRITKPKSNYFKNNFITKKKLKFCDILIEDYPSRNFLKKLKEFRDSKIKKSKTLKLLHVGRISHEKYIYDLVDLMKNLKKLKIASTLNLIGPGEINYIYEIKKYISKNKIENIFFSGPKNNENLVKEYKNHDIVVSPKMGTALREAGLCGSFIICYKDAFTSQAFKHKKDAFVTDKNNCDNLLKGIFFFLKEKEKVKQIKKNIIKTCAKYDARNASLMLHQIFK